MIINKNSQVTLCFVFSICIGYFGNAYVTDLGFGNMKVWILFTLQNTIIVMVDNTSLEIVLIKLGNDF